MLQLSSLTKGYGDRLLFENVNWQVSAGERVGLCGPNGAGKTTLLRMVAASSGRARPRSATFLRTV